MKMRPRGHIRSPTSNRQHQKPTPEPYIPASAPRPQPASGDDPSLREHDRPVQKDAEPTSTVQHMPKPLTNHRVPDNY